MEGAAEVPSGGGEGRKEMGGRQYEAAVVISWGEILFGAIRFIKGAAGS